MSLLDISTQEGYDIACALRGPDITCLLGLKWLLTSRLRWMVGINEENSTGMVRKEPVSKRAAVNAHEEITWYKDLTEGYQDRKRELVWVKPDTIEWYQYGLLRSIEHWLLHMQDALLVVSHPGASSLHNLAACLLAQDWSGARDELLEIVRVENELESEVEQCHKI